jgi:MFS family permease
MGGEIGPTITYLTEIAPPARRGLYCSWQLGSQGLAVLTAGVVGVVLSLSMSTASLEVWGWRIAFLFGAILLPFGLVLRRRLPETIHQPDACLPVPTSGVAQQRTFRIRRSTVLGLVAVASSTSRFYVLAFMTTYAITTLQMQVTASFAPTAIFGSMTLIFSLLGGWISDHVGRKPVMIGCSLLFLLAAYPVFSVISAHRTVATLLTGTAVLSALYPSGIAIAVTESMPKHVRCGSVAIIYAVAIAIVGATTQPFVAWLIRLTGDAVAPAYYLIGTSVIGIVAMIMMEETAPARLAGGK